MDAETNGVLHDHREPCACHRCDRQTKHTEHSPYMDDYCDECTWTRCDVDPSNHAGPRGPLARGL